MKSRYHIFYLGDASNPHMRKWAKHFAKRGYEVHIISFTPAELEDVRIHYVPFYKGIGKLRYLLALEDIKEFIRKNKPDILHAHHATSYGLCGAYSSYHPFIISAWGSDVMITPYISPLHYKIVKWNLRKADYVTATSHTLTMSVKNICPGLSVHTVPFGVNLDIFKPNKVPPLYAMGTVRSLKKKYGIEYLIRSLLIIHKYYPNARLLIVGEGVEKKKLLRLTSEIGLTSYVDFVGKVPNEDVPLYLSKIQIFVIPSIKESFGVAAIEAEACGKPVVASNIGGLPEVIMDGTTGILVPPKSPEAIANACITLLKNPEKIAQMGKNGRKFVEINYDWDKTSRSMEGLYNKILETNTI
jgi:glycosyltransferase involved in cell wall biosynthesis